MTTSRRPHGALYRVFGAFLLIIAAAALAAPGNGVRSHLARARFVASCSRQLPQIGVLLTDSVLTSLNRTLEERPHVIGMAHWPYISSAWTPAERFACLRNHYAELESLPALKALGAEDSVVVSGLQDVAPGLQVVLDRPVWFMREGELAANLFVGGLRAYSIVFSLDHVDGNRIMRIGCIQGCSDAGAMELYRQLTKRLHGMRPRDFVVRVAQIIAAAAGARELHLVADATRIHRHPYFGRKDNAAFNSNYDRIWSEYGAVADTDGFFRLSADAQRKPIEQVDSGKRAMYRRRYALLDRVEGDVRAFMSARVARPGTGARHGFAVA